MATKKAMDDVGPRAALRIALPTMPIYLRLLDVRDGDGELAGIDIAHVRDEDLRAYGQTWTEALIVHAHARREKKG